MDAFVAGRHRYVIPLDHDRGPGGRGICGRNWLRAQEVPLSQLSDEDVDLVILQRPEEIELTTRCLGAAGPVSTFRPSTSSTTPPGRWPLTASILSPAGPTSHWSTSPTSTG